MNIQKQSTSKKRRQLFNILTGQTLYQKPILNENIFNVDLVLKMKFPLDQFQMTIQKSKHVPLDEFVYNPDKRLIEAHQAAYQRLISSSPMIHEVSNKKQQNNIQIQNQVNFKSVQQNQPIVDKQYQGILSNGRKRKIVFPCYVKCTSNQVDCFTLNFNTLMYVLQKKCGFQTKSYLVVEEAQKNSDIKQAYIYILISQSIPNLLKAADRFQIKKQIDYPQIDLFLNEPVDSLSRPYQNNSCISKPELQEKVLNKIKTQKKQQNKKLALSKQSQPIPQIYLKKQQQKERKMKRKDLKTTSQQLNRQQKQKQAQFKKQNQIKQLFKRVHRNMNDKVYKLSELIVEQKQIGQKQQHKISDYLAEFFLEFDKIMQTQIQLTSQQKSYICALNNGKINPKCEKEYIIKLKRKKVFYLIKDLSEKYGHTTYDHPITYFPFMLPSRRLGFMERFRNMLLYEQYIVSPYGDLSPFSKMDRIKIAYLNLKDHIRVQNLNKIGCFVFAIHNDYERYGITGQPLSERKLKQNIKGGINGTNLFDCWNPLTPWTADIQTIRNYFGEDTAYQVYLKTHLILYFIVIAPLGIVGQVVSRLFIYYNAHYTQYMDRGFSSTHKQQLLFHILFFALTIGIFAYFLERWMHKEEDFQETFVQNETRSTFRYHYQGPFIRNNVTDSVNEHKLTLDTRSIVIKSIGFLLILIILGGQCGFFHGMRMAIIQFTKVIPQTNVYLISWSHIICYGIFFIANYFIYNWIIVNFSSFWTKLQNIPTEDLHRDSIRSKNSLFLIGIQLIPVIFLLIFQPFKSTSCYSQSCYDEFTQYIYSRYVIVFIFLGLKLLSFVYLYIQASLKWKSQKNNSQIITFDEKLLNFINFIEAQSTRPEFESTINDQTEALLHYGMFLTSFPLSPLLGLANMILEYLIERIQLIVRNKRPIPKSQALQLYSGNYKIIMHLSIFVNCWLIFFTLEQVEYSFGRLIRIFVSQNPTYEGILVLKIAIIIISIVIFQIYVQIIRFFVSEGSHKMLNNRKKRKYEKHILYKNVIQKNKPTLQVNKIYPFRTIFRTYHKELILRSRKGQNSLTEVSQGTEQQFSAQYLKAKKG